MDFNDAAPQQSGDFSPIPDGTVAPVRLTFKDPAMKKSKTGATGLDVEYVVTAGSYAKRKVWAWIGIAGAPGNEGHVKMVDITKSFLRGALESAYGIMPEDASPEARAARSISGWDELDGLEFLARFRVEKGSDYTDDRTGEVKQGKDKNTLVAVTPDDPDYGPFKPAKHKPKGASRVSNGGAKQPAAAGGARPDWA